MSVYDSKKKKQNKKDCINHPSIHKNEEYVHIKNMLKK